MTSLPLRARLLLLVAAAAVLTACNPLTIVGGGQPVVGYRGPSGSWIEVSLSETGGVAARYTFIILAADPDQPVRRCRDATTGAVEECTGHSDTFQVTSAAFRPAYAPVGGDDFLFVLNCTVGGEDVHCPTSTRLVLRAVDDAGRLVGDLVRVT